jgi:catechol 2,3-dioxygenase-like lactoylglutathione lyase family enzyme
MLDHVTIGVTDLARSRDFYDATLAAIGIARMAAEGGRFAGYGADRPSVARFHQAGLAAGGRDHGAPGLRPHYHAHDYGTFILDPDGHNIEAVCHAAA